jgi:hypothetical protein
LAASPACWTAGNATTPIPPSRSPWR